MVTQTMNSTDIDILPYDPKFSRDFARLNYEWLEKYFIVEDYDAEILLDPQQHIMDPGGEILLAVADGQVVGTTALIVRDADTFELAKMAVTADFQGLRIGQKLMYAAIDYSRRAGKRRIILDSNTKLRPALALYEKVGFREIPYDPNSPYQRCNIRMELML